MRCNNCGYEADSEFCPNCGTKLEKEIEPQVEQDIAVVDKNNIIIEKNTELKTQGKIEKTKLITKKWVKYCFIVFISIVIVGISIFSTISSSIYITNLLKPQNNKFYSISSNSEKKRIERLISELNDEVEIKDMIFPINKKWVESEYNTDFMKSFFVDKKDLNSIQIIVSELTVIENHVLNYYVELEDETEREYIHKDKYKLWHNDYAIEYSYYEIDEDGEENYVYSWKYCLNHTEYWINIYGDRNNQEICDKLFENIFDKLAFYNTD